METYEAGLRAGLKERVLAELSTETLREAVRQADWETVRETGRGKEGAGAGRGME